MPRNTKEKEKKQAFGVTVEDARMVNSSLFKKDQFNEKAAPSYKIEIAVPKNDKNFEAILDAIVNEGLDHLGVKGDLDLDGGDVISGIKDGDVMAKKREKEGKKGDVYKGHWVIRAKTVYNRHGEDAEGGIAVVDEDVQPIIPPDTSAIYNGCYVNVALTLGKYTDDSTGNDALTYYLGAVQKVKDGERLVAVRDAAAAFKPIGRSSSGGEGRRRRG